MSESKEREKKQKIGRKRTLPKNSGPKKVGRKRRKPTGVIHQSLLDLPTSESPFEIPTVPEGHKLVKRKKKKKVTARSEGKRTVDVRMKKGGPRYMELARLANNDNLWSSRGGEYPGDKSRRGYHLWAYGPTFREIQGSDVYGVSKKAILGATSPYPYPHQASRALRQIEPEGQDPIIKYPEFELDGGERFYGRGEMRTELQAARGQKATHLKDRMHAAHLKNTLNYEEERRAKQHVTKARTPNVSKKGKKRKTPGHAYAVTNGIRQ